MPKNNTLKYRVGELEKTKALHEKVLFGESGVLTNHLPHINENIARLDSKMKLVIMINGATVLIGVLISKFL